jgi:hypothetical protein
LLWTKPEADATPVILTNRGIVYPNDGGGFSLRCNEAYGALTSARPDAFIDDQAAVVIATPQDIQRTSDRACSFSSTMGLLTGDAQDATGIALGGFAQDPSNPARGLTTTQIYTMPAQVFISQDYARTWTLLYTNNMYTVYQYLKIAEDGQHVLASGQRYDPTRKKILSIYAYSSDFGKTWTDTALETTRQPLGFLPSDSNVAFMREEIQDPHTIDTRDKLLRSSDGGKTFEQIGTDFPTITAFAATPDGKTVWIGARFGGLFQSDDSGKTFQQILPNMINGADCLYFRKDVLWACANMTPNTDGIFTSKDLGKTFQQNMVFSQVTTQVTCPDMELCEMPWHDWSYELSNGWNSTDGGAAPYIDASLPSADAASGDDYDAGAPPAEAGQRDAATTDQVRKKSEGCALASGSEGGLAWLALASLLLRRRRR